MLVIILNKFMKKKNNFKIKIIEKIIFEWNF